MDRKPSTFAVCIGNRDLFPSGMLNSARRELKQVIEKLGYTAIFSPEKMTSDGAVKNVAEGRKFAAFLEEHQGEYDGIILSLPNFGDENAAAEALKDAGVPILVHAYPDTMDAMGPEYRRDAYCGKLSVMNVLRQYTIPFTALKPHVISPSDSQFQEHLRVFDGICRVVNGMRRCTLGALGARTTAFKTVRFDELTMQKHGMTVESLDLSEIISRVRSVDTSSSGFKQKQELLTSYADFSQATKSAREHLICLSMVLDEIIGEYNLDMLALRCWIELQKQLQISPCVLLGELNNRGFPAACEMDGSTAASMYALRLAADAPAACLDWNNNYEGEQEKCILFHCGPVAADMLASQGALKNHAMFDRVLGPGVSCGCHPGRIAPGAMTFAGGKTENGELSFYIGEGEFTPDPIPDEFFGCAGTAWIPGLQEVLYTVGTEGYHHHVGAVHGKVASIVQEAFSRYLGYHITPFQSECCR